jgi:hypothetical protein
MRIGLQIGQRDHLSWCSRRGHGNPPTPASPAALASDAEPVSTPIARRKASADVEKIADTASVHPVVAASTPCLRNCR